MIREETKQEFQSLFYWITYSYNELGILIIKSVDGFNPYFIGLPILIGLHHPYLEQRSACFNPYFIGLPILIIKSLWRYKSILSRFQSLFYWITYSYVIEAKRQIQILKVSILILLDYLFLSSHGFISFHLLIVSILILLDYLFL